MTDSVRRVDVSRGYGPATRAPAARGGVPFSGTLDALLRPAGKAQPEAVPSEGIRFSRHAQARLDSREVQLQEADLARLDEAIDRLAARGSRESLVLLGDNAFVVGVPKRTVITVMPKQEALGTIFTQIDSTFIAS